MKHKISDWYDLVGLQNENYYLEVDTFYGKGYIRPKKKELCKIYLTTHTFYPEYLDGLQKILTDCGFDVDVEGRSNETENI